MNLTFFFSAEHAGDTSDEQEKKTAHLERKVRVYRRVNKRLRRERRTLRGEKYGLELEIRQLKQKVADLTLQVSSRQGKKKLLFCFCL